ncbi:gld2, partial [Symbiodinium pilosum]
MPRIVLGTGGFEGLSGKVGRAAMLAALKMGYRGIDTSEMNRNLIDIRWACQRAGVDRKDLFLVLKIPPWSHGYDGVLQSFRRQTSQLRLDYVDLVLIQWPHVWSLEQRDWGPAQWSKANQTKASMRRESWKAMEELFNSGRARAIGVSNHTIDDMEAILQGCAVPPMVMQGESHPHWPNRPVRDWCRKHEIIFQGYAPFGGQETDQNSGHRAVDDDVVHSVATRNGLTPFQVCMQWNQARNSSTVVKSKNILHLRENLAACNQRLCAAADLGRIDERAKEFLKYGPCYWGHNDMDYMHPWKDEEKMLESMFSDGALEA